MEINPIPSLPGNLDKTGDSWGRFIEAALLLLVMIFPWVVWPSMTSSLELPREVLLFSVVGILWVAYFFRALKREEFEWRRSKLGWLFLVWLVTLALLFLYSSNFKIAWEGYLGSMTAGLSEYLAFLGLFLLGVQVFNAQGWRELGRIFMISLTAVLLFYIAATVYFQNNNVLTINFARTPSLVTAALGVMALAFWWTLKRTEYVKKARSFILVLIVFFISSLLDFYVAWWMWVTGTAVLLIFDLVGRSEIFSRNREVRTLGLQKEKAGLATLLFQGDAKYLFLFLLFALSRALSPLFLGQQKIALLPFFSYLTEYHLLGQRVFFYLFLNLLIFCWGIFSYWESKKDRSEILFVLSGIAAITVGHLLYYSESTILYFLNWILIVYSGLTFLRKAPEKDFLIFLKTGSRARKIFFAVGTVFSLVILGLIVLRVRSLWS